MRPHPPATADSETEGGHRRPHNPPMPLPFLEYDLVRELLHLHEETSWKNGQNAKTLVKYDDLRVILIALKCNACMPEHKAPGRISIHMISGHIHLHAFERTFDLLPGSLLALDTGIPHNLQALEESAFLLTIAWPGRSGTRNEKI